MRKSRTSQVHELSAPFYKPKSVKEHHWGGDGTVGVPDSVRVRLVYNTLLAPATTLGSLYAYQFRGNSVFDPDYTSAGAQPIYYDQWSNMYTSYVVLSSHIRVEFVSLIAGSAPCLAGVFPAYNTSTGTAAIDCASNRYAKSLSTGSQGNAVRSVVSCNMSTAQMFGIDPVAVVTDDAYSGAGGNPATAQTWFWTVFAQAESGTSTMSGNIRVQLEYDVKFFDPVVVNLSSTRRLTPKDSGAAAAAAAAAVEQPDPMRTLSELLRKCCSSCPVELDALRKNPAE